MFHLIFSFAFYAKCVYNALSRTIFGMYDQTHYYVAEVKLNLVAIFHEILRYILAIPSSFVAHFQHFVYLRELGMEGVDNLNDVGNLVFMNIPSNANKVGSNSVARVTGLQNNSSGNTDHLNISASAICKLWQVLHDAIGFEFPHTLFLDFGCGTGFALLSAMTQPFHNILGVDLDSHSCRLAEENIAKFLSSNTRHVPVQCEKVTIIAKDMAAYAFDHIPGDVNTIVMYMYEPLWTVPKPRAHQIYLDILTRAAMIPGKRVIVAYFYAGWFNGDALPAFRELNAELLTKFEFDSLNFASSATCYMYQLN